VGAVPRLGWGGWSCLAQAVTQPLLPMPTGVVCKRAADSMQTNGKITPCLWRGSATPPFSPKQPHAKHGRMCPRGCRCTEMLAAISLLSGVTILGIQEDALQLRLRCCIALDGAADGAPPRQLCLPSANTARRTTAPLLAAAALWPLLAAALWPLLTPRGEHRCEHRLSEHRCFLWVQCWPAHGGCAAVPWPGVACTAAVTRQAAARLPARPPTPCRRQRQPDRGP